MITESLFICNEQERRRIPFNSILYITIEDYLSTFVLSDQQTFVCSKPLCEIKDCLPLCFYQINRSCIINLNEIISIKRYSRLVILTDKSEHTVSGRRMKELNNALNVQNITLARREVSSTGFLS